MPHDIGNQHVRKRPRVMIADDHAEVAKAASRLLSHDCEVVGTITDGRAVLDAVQRLQPDVVVLDLHMPNVKGLEVCRQITQLHPHVRVVVFSATNDPEVAQLAAEAGASACVSKGTGDLRSTIKRVCE